MNASTDGTWEPPGGDSVVVGAYPSIKPPPPGVPVNALAATQILLDLISELRYNHIDNCITSPQPFTGCPECGQNTPCLASEPCNWERIISRAEARLREVTGGDAAAPPRGNDDSNDWTVLWLPIDAEEAATCVAIADALVRAFGRVDPDDVEFGSRTWDRGPLGDSVMAWVEARLRKKPGDE